MNCRHRDFQSRALPTELPAQVRAESLEPSAEQVLGTAAECLVPGAEPETGAGGDAVQTGIGGLCWLKNER